MFWASKEFEFKDIPDLTGKIAIITGSNTGIGKVCALEMARKGCQVVIGCRDEKKANAAMEDIKKSTGNDKVEFIRLDLMSLQSVKEFADTFKARYDRLHILMNNAGVMMCPFALSKDGIETQFATNHVGHFYLTVQLLPLLEQSAPSRIINVSSIAHHTPFKRLDLEHISDEKRYNRIIHYGKSKTANILFTRELNKRLQAKGCKNVYVNCNHPGMVQSELERHIVGGLLPGFLYRMFQISTEDGALAQLFLATSPKVEQENITGEYYVPYGKRAQTTTMAASDEVALELWNFTENLLKEKIPGYTGAGI
ncbi:uncharacterized protein BYT42DRAFT_568378 [Radiomyces spectabilis]|uniref:uncharacterized protein n=1 Tax=Radiomyces spectabilis TaxID=64574 RepID=UPI00221FDA66|nr:uncharacterized protein BYT42DRAFT_568378 [Radiomyces spectabilis]KAI8379308.1 hypothetical protein BYT42DRAFT_568378 [Radiomyces spectabilis]